MYTRVCLYGSRVMCVYTCICTYMYVVYVYVCVWDMDKGFVWDGKRSLSERRRSLRVGEVEGVNFKTRWETQILREGVVGG